MTGGHDDPTRAFGEELRCRRPLLQRDDRLHGRAAAGKEVEGLTGAAHGERSADRITHRNGSPCRRGPGRTSGRHGRVEDPEAQEGELLPRLPGAAADGREGAGSGDPGGLIKGVSTRSVDDLVQAMVDCSGVSSEPGLQAVRPRSTVFNGFLWRPLEGDWPLSLARRHLCEGLRAGRAHRPGRGHRRGRGRRPRRLPRGAGHGPARRSCPDLSGPSLLRSLARRGLQRA